MRSRIRSLFPLCVLLFLVLALAPLHAAPRMDPCPTCGGSGTVACGVCGGAGFIPAPPANGLPAAYGCEACGGVRGDPYNGSPGSPGTGRVPCSTCNGTGEVEHQLTPEEKKAQEDAANYYQRGLIYMRAKQYARAITEFESALASWSEHPDARNMIDEARRLKQKQEDLHRSLLRDMKNLAGDINSGSGETTLPRQDSNPNSGSSGLDIYRENGPVTNPQIVKIMHKLNSIDVPEPISSDEALIEFSRISANDDSAEKLLERTETGLAVFNVSQLMLVGKALGSVPTAVLATGKVILAGSDGADLYLMKKGLACDRALRYLKDKRTAAQFSGIANALRQGKSPPRGASKQMIAAAKAILDPANGYTGKRIVWNAMWSPEAKSAMLSRAFIEIGAECISRGTEGMVTDLIAARDPAFKSAMEVIESSQARLAVAKDPAERAVLKEAISKADTIMVRAYQAGTSVLGNLISGGAAGSAENGLGRKD